MRHEVYRDGDKEFCRRCGAQWTLGFGPKEGRGCPGWTANDDPGLSNMAADKVMKDAQLMADLELAVGKLEPQAILLQGYMSNLGGRNQTDKVLMASIAISLKRIADALAGPKGPSPSIVREGGSPSG